MAIRFLATLTKTERLSFPAIRGFIRQGIRPTEALRLFRKAGGAIRTQRWFQAFDRLHTEVLRGGHVRFLPMQRRPLHARLPIATGNLRRRYSFQVDVFGTEIGTDRPAVQTVTVSSPDLLTRAELEAQAIEAVRKLEDEYRLRIERAQLTHGVRRADPGELA